MAEPDVYLGGTDPIPGFNRLAQGKVRDVYELDAEHLLFVTTDRISAFDVIMDAGVPFKGAVLTAISVHWFERTRDIVPNHLVSARVEDVPGLSPEWRARLAGRVMVVRRCQPDPIEWVVRGYLAGSGWKEYQRSGTVCGIPLPVGLQQASELPRPILTPTTKSDAHDRPISPEEAADMLGAEHFRAGERICLALYERGRRELAPLGIRLADTKFELGRRGGELLLIDEVMTPDSSRFWDERVYRVGTSPESYDKQILRDHLETLDWDKNYPAPYVDPRVLERVAQRYLEICERITGRSPAAASRT